ncbi:precorrin-6y C5,15-methyltransferase (decarboxylating) subunit CbiE [Ruminococcus flavefaciens]|uniref:precorrin-6y C5,15-methyltransferase (decarboxylating) subunit CbiE n=1 Tax=Ruminococcus flavefaciens TaxID=1265 RepID=UPI0026E939C8|nr:precorrin-6y C5,15-methyltransferase (decarboxylating) subunit CbiE [Ruminococcus flavefaciens]MDD7515682.1 precorrin-6y C5,15-methyltransferase (decarboxylating) subunit CbiE [Ruminococcus flavefaciens]MDY5690302.1 precorrin-6y C5,15-methyltransferase (decarboxylating) subunit CbiE [Ruminococcus flavefaciens]
MKVYIVGIGMGTPKTMTAEAAEAVEKADILIGAKRMIAPFKDKGKPCFEEYRSDEIVRIIAENTCQCAVVLMSGDCGFFSGAKKLSAKLCNTDTEIISGISSPVYFLSKLKKDWSDCNFVSLHGQNANIVRNVSSHEKTFFLLGGEMTVSRLCRRLCDYGMDDISVYIGEDLGYENERISCGKASEFLNHAASELCVLLAENPNYERHIRCGIDDEEFIRGKVPMTKKEIRANVVTGLEIGKNDVCWDIGCGTGSVSVEMALQCINGRVYSIDKNQEAVALTAENRRKFGCDNIDIIEGDAAEKAAGLPAPDCVFIGGSSGELEEIIHIALTKNSNLQLTINSVSLETLSESIRIFDKYGIEAEITQIAVTRTRKIGRHTMMSAENPVFIIKRKLK